MQTIAIQMRELHAEPRFMRGLIVEYAKAKDLKLEPKSSDEKRKDLNLKERLNHCIYLLDEVEELYSIKQMNNDLLFVQGVLFGLGLCSASGPSGEELGAKNLELPLPNMEGIQPLFWADKKN